MELKTLRRRLFAGLALGFAVILGLVLVGDARQVAEHLAIFSWGFAPLILGFTLLNYLLRFIKWHYYLGLIGIRALSIKESARIFLAGFPLAVTPGKVGEVLKGVWLHQATGTRTARGITVVVAERISDGLAVLALSSMGAIAYPQYWPAFVTVLALLTAAVVLSQARPLALAMIRLMERLPFLRRFVSGTREFYEGAYTLFHPRAILTAVSLGTVAWLGEGIAMYLVLRGLGVPPGWRSLSLAIFILSFSTVVGAVSALPGGLVAAEASIAGMLTLLMGLPKETAAAATLLIRFATLWFAVALGLTTWAFSRSLLTGEAGKNPDSENTQ